MNHQSYYAIIPAPVRYCKDIADGAKLLYGEITALSNQNGYCWATNAYFAGLYDVSEKTISRWISSLAREGFIITLVDSAAANSRKMWLAGSPGVSPKMSIPMDKNVHTLSPKMSIPMDKNVHHNNTVNNTTNNTVENSAAKPLSHPFQKVGEIEIPENISLETQKKEKSSPGAGGDVTPGRSTGAVRLSIVDPELPGVRIEEEIQPKTLPGKTGRSKSKNPRTGTADEIDLAVRVIEYLNQAAGRSFRINAGENAKGIIARHREGFTEAELKKVIDFKVKAWGSDPAMCEHLNPVTLFRPSNFERYLQGANAMPKAQPVTRSTIQPFSGTNYNEKQSF